MPYRIIITISYSAKVIPLMTYITPPWAINDFFQENIEDIIIPIINDVMNAEWAEFISTDEVEHETDNKQYLCGVQRVTIDVNYIEKIENYKDALSAEIEKAFNLLGLDASIEIEFER